MPSATSPLLPQPPTLADIPPFPSASTFSILPDLFILLSRLAPLQAAGATSTDPSSTIANTLHLISSNEPPLTTAEIPTAVYPIRQKIQKAIAALKALPDIERSMDAQQVEMRALNARIGALKVRLGELAHIAERGSRKEDAMEGVEDTG